MYGKKSSFSMKPHLSTFNPSNMPANSPRLNTPFSQNFPSLQAFSIFNPLPQSNSSISSNDLEYITPGKYAVLGFLADNSRTSETDRFMATQLGRYFRCHTCGAFQKLVKNLLRIINHLHVFSQNSLMS